MKCKNMGKLETLSIADENVNLYKHSGDVNNIWLKHIWKYPMSTN